MCTHQEGLLHRHYKTCFDLFYAMGVALSEAMAHVADTLAHLCRSHGSLPGETASIMKIPVTLSLEEQGREAVLPRQPAVELSEPFRPFAKLIEGGVKEAAHVAWIRGDGGMAAGITRSA